MRLNTIYFAAFGLLLSINLAGQEDYFTATGLGEYIPGPTNSIHLQIEGWWDDVWCDYLEFVELTDINVTIDGLPNSFNPSPSFICSGPLSSVPDHTELILSPNIDEGEWNSEENSTYIPSWKFHPSRYDELWLNFTLDPYEEISNREFTITITMVGGACGFNNHTYSQSFTVSIPLPDLTFHFKDSYCDMLSNDECHPTFNDDINAPIDFTVYAYNDGGPIWNTKELVFFLKGKYTPDLQHQKDIITKGFEKVIAIDHGFIKAYSGVSCTWSLVRDDHRKYFIPTYFEADSKDKVTESSEWNNVVDYVDYDCKFVLVWKDLPDHIDYPWPFKFDDSEFDNGVITSVLNEPRSVGLNWGRFHSGTDIGKPPRGGENVLACSSGRIVYTNSELGSSDVGDFKYVHISAPQDAYHLNYFQHERAWINSLNIVGSMPIYHVHLIEYPLDEYTINPLRDEGLSPSVENHGDVKYYDAYAKDVWGNNTPLTVGDRYIPFAAYSLSPGSYTFYLNLMDEGYFSGAMGIYSISTVLYLVDIHGEPLSNLGSWQIEMDTWLPNEPEHISNVFEYFYDPDKCISNGKKPYVLTNSLNGESYTTQVNLLLSGAYMMQVDVIGEKRSIDHVRAFISFYVD